MTTQQKGSGVCLLCCAVPGQACCQHPHTQTHLHTHTAGASSLKLLSLLFLVSCCCFLRVYINIDHASLWTQEQYFKLTGQEVPADALVSDGKFKG